MTFKVKNELLMLLNHVLQFFDVAFLQRLIALGTLGQFQPLFQTPNVVFQLGPVSARADGADQTTFVTELKIKELMNLIGFVKIEK